MIDSREGKKTSVKETLGGTSVFSVPKKWKIENRRDRFEVARLTPSGRGAVACVGVRGARAQSVFLERWSRPDGTRLEFAPWTSDVAGRPYFGLFRFDELGGVSEEIVLRRRTANSFELNCHGGDLASSRLIRYFTERGAAETTDDEWERAVVLEERGFWDDRFNERLVDPIESLFYRAVDELVSKATTELIAKLAMRQRGVWREFFDSVSSTLEQSDGNPREIDALVDRIDAVLSRGLWGRWLCAPITATLLGAPNVGKSSLLNAVLGYDRVVVSPTAGTTRDLVEVPLVIDGWNFLLIDAAGLRETSDEIERTGVLLALESARRADVVLKVYDVERTRAEQDDLFARFLGDERKAVEKSLIVLNKTDLPESNWGEDWRLGGASDVAKVSAKTCDGVEELFLALVRSAFEGTTPGRGPALWTREQTEYLLELRNNLLNYHKLIG